MKQTNNKEDTNKIQQGNCAIDHQQYRINSNDETDCDSERRIGGA